MPKISTILRIVMFLCLFSCSGQKRSRNWDEQNVKLVRVSDSTYNNATQSAQKNLPEFIGLLAQKNNNKYKFNISVMYTEDGHSEQLWFMVDSFIDGKFNVKLNNVPMHFERLKLHDKLEIAKENVRDWLVSKNHKVVAGNFAKADLD